MTVAEIADAAPLSSDDEIMTNERLASGDESMTAVDEKRKRFKRKRKRRHIHSRPHRLLEGAINPSDAVAISRAYQTLPFQPKLKLNDRVGRSHPLGLSRQVAANKEKTMTHRMTRGKKAHMTRKRTSTVWAPKKESKVKNVRAHVTL
jgi:hypothetical protein